MSNIKWEEPPPKKTGPKPNAKHAAIAAELRRNPGRWAKVFTDASPATAANIRNGHPAAYQPTGSFEVAARNQHRNGKGSTRVDIYVRYIGEPS